MLDYNFLSMLLATACRNYIFCPCENQALFNLLFYGEWEGWSDLGLIASSNVSKIHESCILLIIKIYL